MTGTGSLLVALALAASGDAQPAVPGGGNKASLQHERSPETITDLRPEVLLYGHLYEGRFKGVSAVYCDPLSGEIYVADPGRNAIGIFSDKGSPIFTFSDVEHLSEPRRVLAARDGRILVADNDHARIKVFSYRGEFLSYLELPWPAGRKEVVITAMAFDAEDNLYVADSRAGEVVVFDPALEAVKARIGKKGNGKGQLMTVVGIAVDAENVYVADQESLAVQVFTRYGRFLRGWGFHDGGVHNVSLPQGIAVDPKGRIVLVDMLRQEIKYFDAQGRLIDNFGGFGARPGEVAYPSDVSVDRGGRLCVAERGNARVQVLSVVEPVRAPSAAREAPSAAR